MRVETIEDLEKVANTLRLGCQMMSDLPNQVLFLAAMPEHRRADELKDFTEWMEQFVPGLLAAADLCEQLAAGRSTRN